LPARILRNKPFTDFTTDDFHALVSINLLGFVYVPRLSVKQQYSSLVDWAEQSNCRFAPQ
jgi:hypothetical protein